MSTQKGFIGLAALLAIVLGLIVIGGGAYYVMHQNAASQTPQNLPDISAIQQTPSQTPTNNAPTTQSTNTRTSGIIPATPDNNYGCYTKNSTTIFLRSTAVQGADVATFQDVSPYGLCLGKDKNHVFRDATILTGFDPATFNLLWYAKPGPVLFYQSGSSIVAFSFASDDDSTFQGMKTVPNGVPTTFKQMLGSYDFAPWAKDKNNVYCDGTILSGADPASAHLDKQGLHLLVNINGVEYTYDSGCHGSAQSQSSVSGSSNINSVTFTASSTSGPAPFAVILNAFGNLFYGNLKIEFGDGTENLNPKWSSYDSLGQPNGTSVSHTYASPGSYTAQLMAQKCAGAPMPTCGSWQTIGTATILVTVSSASNVSISQLTHIGGSYYKDSQYVYSQVGYGAPQIMSGADPASFLYLGNPRGYDMGKDTQHVYVFTQVSSADPSTLVILDNGEWMKDSQHVYEGGGLSPISGSDPNTFAIVEEGNFVKDATHVWTWNGNLLSSADPSTFTILSGGYEKDISHVWYGAELIPNADMNTFVVTGDGTAKDANHVYGHSAPDHLGNTRLTIDGVIE